MSKTPRVDDREFAAIDLKPSSRVVYASFARQLETELADKDRQLAEARAEIERLKEGRDFWRNKCEREESEAGAAMIRYVCKEQEFEKQLSSARLTLIQMEKDFVAETNQNLVRAAEIEHKDKLIEQMRTTLIAARNGLLIACDDDENNSRVKRFFDYIDSALAAERGE